VRAALKPLVRAALHTGFRKSELLSLTWEDIDFRRGVITVRAAYAKNGESRSVPMNKSLTETLKAIRMSESMTQHVFCNRDGVPYRSFRSAFDRAVQTAGLGDLTFHDLRHVFASRLIMNGVDLPTVKELLGHKVIAMTLRYTHLSSDHKRQAVQTLEPSVAKVPAIFTTRRASQASSSSQVIEISSVPR
jgi:integrase